MNAAEALSEQCQEASQRCLFTSTTLFLWVRQLRLIRFVFIVLPIALGSLAGWKLLQADQRASVLTAIFTFLAARIPAIYFPLELDDHLPIAARLAGEYKPRDRLPGPAEGRPYRPLNEFRADYLGARERLEKADSEAHTAPEKLLLACDAEDRQAPGLVIRQIIESLRAAGTDAKASYEKSVSCGPGSRPRPEPQPKVADLGVSALTGDDPSRIFTKPRTRPCLGASPSARRKDNRRARIVAR